MFSYGNYDYGMLDQYNEAMKQRLAYEEAMRAPLVSPLSETLDLQQEHVHQPTVALKLQSISKRFPLMRQVRRDGNCFYRSFLFSLFELLLKADLEEPKQDKQEVQQDQKNKKQEIDKNLRALVSYFLDKKSLFSRFEKQGLSLIAVETFYDVFEEELNFILAQNKKLKEGKTSKQERKEGEEEEVFSLEDRFCKEEDTYKYVIGFLRFLTSLHLRENAELFSFYMPEDERTGQAVSVESFCEHEIEVSNKDVDMVSLVALTNELKTISIEIVYCDQTAGAYNTHIFPDSSKSFLYFLYRPGHYEVLYEAETVVSKEGKQECQNQKQ